MSRFIQILKYKLLSFIRYNKKVDFRELIKSLLSSLVFISFAYGAYYFSFGITKYLIETIKIGSFLYHEFISVILFIFFLSVNLGNIVVSYSTLFKSEEVKFLLTKPIPAGEIFILKFFDNFFYSSGTLIMMLCSVLLGYADYYNLNIFFLLEILIFGFFPFMLLSASLGTAVLFLIIKMGIKFGIKQIVTILILIYLTLIFLYFEIASPLNIVKKVLDSYPDIDKYFGNLIPGAIKYLPNNWLSEALYWNSAGSTSHSQYLLLLLTSSAILAMVLLFKLGKKSYYKFWIAAEGFKNKLKKRKPDYPNSLLCKIDSQKSLTAIILKRDLLLFIRDPGQIGHLSIMLLLIFIYVFSVGSLAKLHYPTPLIYAAAYLTIIIFDSLLISALSLRFIFPIISAEGLQYWKILTAPVKSDALIKKRLLPWRILSVFMIMLMTFFSLYKFSPPLILPSIITLISFTLLQINMNFGMGGYFVNYSEKNAIRIASSRGASLTFLLSLIFVLILIILYFKPVYLFFAEYKMNGYEPISIIYYYSIFFALLSFILSALFKNIGFKTLEKDY